MMQNESVLKQGTQSRASPKNLLKIFVLLDLFFSIHVFFSIIMYNPTNFLELMPSYISIILLMFWGPLLITIGGVSYIARMTNISRIPSNCSLHDAITLPTIQYGQLKIILPVIEEETFEEDEVS